MKGLISKIHLVAILLALLAGPFNPAQAAARQATLHLDLVESGGFPQVALHFSAWDARGLPLSGLLREHFFLSEDAGPPFHPTSLQVDAQAQLRVVLAIDVSESMLGAPLADAKSAAARFLDRLVPGQDQAAVLGFSGALNPAGPNPKYQIGFGEDLTPAYDLIESLQAGGTTPLYEAAAKAVGLFADQPPGHRAVLLLSDGRNDPPEIGDPDKAIATAKDLNAPFFVIGLGSQVDLPYLQRLAFETGGLFLAAPRSAELAGLFNNMATLLKTRYRLSYTSALPADGLPHTLSVTLQQGELTAGLQTTLAAPLQLTQAPPTPTDLPTPTAPTASVTAPSPTQTPTPAALPPPAAACASSLESFSCFLASGWLWLLGLVFLAGAGYLVFHPRRKPPLPEACAKCGYDLTGLAGPCPQCGANKRLPKK